MKKPSRMSDKNQLHLRGYGNAEFTMERLGNYFVNSRPFRLIQFLTVLGDTAK
jgi:hypothetical protein